VAYIVLRLMFKKSILQKIGIIVTVLVLSSGYISAYESKGFISNTVGFISTASISIFGLFFIVRMIKKPLDNTINKVEEVGNGNLNTEINTDIKNNEIGRLEMTLSTLTSNLLETIKRVKIHSKKMVLTSDQLGSASEEISQGANEQASASEEISASMEEMAASIAQNAENAAITEKVAREVSEGMEGILKSVNETTEAMRNITKKIMIVNDIAERIDLLAINAAIEAARAGEHGKGFAVVANEVRKLAEKSQAAANDIDSVSKNSVSVADRSYELLEKMLPKIKNTVDLVQEISASSSEQSSGINQVNIAIQEFAGVTQKNSSSASRLNEYSNELKKQSSELVESIAYFKTENAKIVS
jgi:methyl-accepting chemotaxis protein